MTQTKDQLKPFDNNDEAAKFLRSQGFSEDFLDIGQDGEKEMTEEDVLFESMMEDWFGEGNSDLVSEEEGGVDLVEEESYQPKVTSRLDNGSVNEEDYEDGPQRFAFELIKKNVRNACVKSIKEKPRFAAIEWLFIPNHGELSFDLCCQALGVRPNLIRLRLVYQFYTSWLVFPEPLPFMAQGLPETLCAEILYDEGEGGLWLAQRIWSWPSIELERIALFAKERKIANWERIMEKFDARGFVSNKPGTKNWYFTGRNPSAMSVVRRNEFNWTRVAV